MKKTKYSIYVAVIFCQLFTSTGYSADSGQSTSGSVGKNDTPPTLNAQQKAMAKQFEEMKKKMKLMQKGYNPANKSTSGQPTSQKEAFENLMKKMGKSAGAPPHARKFRKSLTKEQSKALREKNITTIPKHKLAGEWKNKYGDVVRLQSSGHFYSKIHKNIFWESRKNKITFYDVTRDSSGELIKGLRATYDNKVDAITIIGNKYKVFPYYRYDEAQKEKERLAKIQKREKDRKIIKFALQKDQEREKKAKKLSANFYETLTCNNCDLTSLKDHYYDCSWCEAEGSVFSKSNKLWSKYQFKWAKLKGADFSGTSIRDTSFYRADLRGADFSGARIGLTNFAYANLENANFRNAHIGESLFNGANLKNADFTGAKIVRVDFSFADVNEQMFKSASLEDVKLKESSLDKQLVGVWHMNIKYAYKGVHYYEFFNDGYYLATKGKLKRPSETLGRERKMPAQGFYSIRKGALEKMNPYIGFIDSDRYSKIIPKIQGNKLILSSSEIYTRTRGKELEKYMKFRNRDFALNTAFYWRTEMLDKLSSMGVGYANLQDIYSSDIFNMLFQFSNYIGPMDMQDIVMEDRNTRYIFNVLMRDNKDIRSGSGFEKMLFISVKSGYVDTVKYLLSQATNKADLQHALIKYEKLAAKSKNVRTNKFFGLNQIRAIEKQVPICVKLIKDKISKF